MSRIRRRTTLLTCVAATALIAPMALAQSAWAEPAPEKTDDAEVQEVIDEELQDAESDLQAPPGTASTKRDSTKTEKSRSASAWPDMSLPGPADIENPVSAPFADSYADPAILRGRDGFFYAYATSDPLTAGGEFGDMHVARTKDFADWEYMGTIFDDDNRPEWAAEDSFFWAPDVRYVDGEYRMYYTVTSSADKPGEDPGIGLATAPTPAGPWTDVGEPVIESQEIEAAAETGVEPQTDEGEEDAQQDEDAPAYEGLIDPAVFADDDGSLYLYVGGFAGGPRATKLSDDGRTAEEPLEQVAVSDRYEGSYVVRHGDYYYLMLSSAHCCMGSASGYSVSVGRAESPMGPFIDADGVPLMDSKAGGTQVLNSNGNSWVGVGHHSVFSDTTGQDWMLYHGIDRDDPWLEEPGEINKRPMLLDRMDWVDGWPVVNAGEGPTEEPQPGPITGSALGIDSTDPAAGKALTSLTGSLRSVEDEDGDAGAVAALRPKHAVPAVATARTPVWGERRTETDIRLADADSRACVRVDSLTGGTQVCLDGRRGELVLTDRKGEREKVDVPDRVDLTSWHSLILTESDDGVRAELQESRLGDPVAVAASDVSAAGSGLLSLTSTRGGADLDNLSVAPLAEGPDELAPEPEIGDARETESFDGDLEDVYDNGWELEGDDPGLEVTDGNLNWPLTDEDISDENGEAPLLLRDAPEGDWVIETDMSLDLGEDTERNFQQGGLIVYGDSEEFLRLSSVAIGQSRNIEFLTKHEAVGDEIVQGGHLDGPAETDVTLRLVRTHAEDGEQRYRSAFSTDDGESWNWGMTWTLPADTDVRIGLQAGGGDEPPTDAQFEEFRLLEAG